MEIIKTNYLNILGVMVGIFLYVFITTYIDASNSIYQALLISCLLVGGYGSIFWIGYLLALIILDLIFVIPNIKKLKTMLILEWGIISLPLIYWGIKYQYQRDFYIISILIFAISQSLRYKVIIRIIGK